MIAHGNQLSPCVVEIVVGEVSDEAARSEEQYGQHTEAEEEQKQQNERLMLLIKASEVAHS